MINETLPSRPAATALLPWPGALRRHSSTDLDAQAQP